MSSWSGKSHSHLGREKSSIAMCGALWYKISLWPIQVSCPSCVSSQLLPAGAELKRKPRYCANTIQQEPKHGCVISTVLVPNPKHSTVQSATKKVNSIAARPSAERSSLSQDAGAAPYDLVSPAHTQPGVQVFFQLKQDGNSSSGKDRWASQSFIFGLTLWEPHVASGCLWRSWLKIAVWEITWQCLKLKKCPVSL